MWCGRRCERGLRLGFRLLRIVANAGLFPHPFGCDSHKKIDRRRFSREQTLSGVGGPSLRESGAGPHLARQIETMTDRSGVKGLLAVRLSQASKVSEDGETQEDEVRGEGD